VVLVSHELDSVRAVADREVRLTDGLLEAVQKF
jgi:ABC-type sulfate/molybdate transport systems ATPase subunit